MSETDLLNPEEKAALLAFEGKHIDLREGARPCIKKSSYAYLRALLAKYGFPPVILTVYDDKCKKAIEVVLHAEAQEALELERIGVLEHIDFSASVARLVDSQDEAVEPSLPPNVVSIFKKK